MSAPAVEVAKWDQLRRQIRALRMQRALMTGALIGMRARIQQFRRICRDYTDTGDAWELLDTIERVAGDVLPVDPPKRSKRVLGQPGAKSGRRSARPKKGTK